MSEWYMLTLVGEDRPGIVAQVSQALYASGCALGEASMMRLGENFTIMLMVSGGGDAEVLARELGSVAESLGLRLHVDPIQGGLHRHQMPNVQIRVHGADRPGIVAQVTGALAACGFNILELDSDVAGDAERPVYIMNIQGVSDRTLEDINSALEDVSGQGVEVDVCSVETLIG